MERIQKMNIEIEEIQNKLDHFRVKVDEMLVYL